MTEGQRSKIFDNNFDEFVQKPLLEQFERDGIDNLVARLNELPRSDRKLPTPYTEANPEPMQDQDPVPKGETQVLERAEKEKIASLLFPLAETS